MPIHDETYIEVSLDNLLFNVNQLRKAIPTDRKIIAVVKDNAYGCGSVAIAKTLEESCCADLFAVARFSEAVSLRNAGIITPLLILGKTGKDLISSNPYNNIIYTLNDVDDIIQWSSIGRDIRFHINIDTGMTRMGILPCELISLIPILHKSKNCKCIGVCTHFACADEPKTSKVASQLSIFNKAVEQLRSSNIPIDAIHFSNSAASIRFGLESCTHIRPGISLYGCKPDPSQEFTIQLKSIASLKSTVIKMKKVPAGTKVSYGGHYQTDSETWIAVIPAGYAQGVPRFLSNRGDVLIGGKRYRIAGNVTMDYIMIDAGPTPTISPGDSVVIIGNQGNEFISPDHIALIGNTIGYEILCNLGKSINRVYIRNESIVMHSPGIIF